VSVRGTSSQAEDHPKAGVFGRAMSLSRSHDRQQGENFLKEDGVDSLPSVYQQSLLLSPCAKVTRRETLIRQRSSKRDCRLESMEDALTQEGKTGSPLPRDLRLFAMEVLKHGSGCYQQCYTALYSRTDNIGTVF
jgi:hypothetical protein